MADSVSNGKRRHEPHPGGEVLAGGGSRSVGGSSSSAPTGRGSPCSGVVGDVRQMSLAEPPREELYISYRAFAGQEMSMVVRTTR